MYTSIRDALMIYEELKKPMFSDRKIILVQGLYSIYMRFFLTLSIFVGSIIPPGDEFRNIIRKLL